MVGAAFKGGEVLLGRAIMRTIPTLQGGKA
jgi:hypothetical protein